MKVHNLFFVFVLISALHLSCHSSKKEVRSEQAGFQGTSSSAVSLEKNAVQNSLSSFIPQKYTSTINDTVVGIVYVSGNEPFTYLVVTPSPDVRYAIEADSTLKAQLWQLQGKKIGIIGIKKTGLAGTSIQVKSFQQSP